MKQSRLQEISFIKTTMMIIIVLYHCCLFFGGEWFTYISPVFNTKGLFVFAKWLNTFHIHTFVMSSGFLFFYLKDKGKYNNYKDDIIKRAKRLLLPYLFTSLFWVIPIATYFFKYSIKDIFKKFVLCTSPGQLWFLIMLFIVFIIFELISNKIKINNIYLIIFYVVSVTLAGAFGYLNINYFQIINVCKYIFFFYLGGYLYKYKDKFDFKKGILLFIFGALLGASLLYLNENILVYKVARLFIMQLFSTIEVVLIYMVCNYIINKKKLSTNNKLYKLLEDNSFGIYLFHQQIIYFCILLLNGVVHPIIQVLISFVVALLISLAISLLLKKNETTKVMFGL